MAVVYRPIRDSGSEEPHDRKCRDGSFGFSADLFATRLSSNEDHVTLPINLFPSLTAHAQLKINPNTLLRYHVARRLSCPTKFITLHYMSSSPQERGRTRSRGQNSSYAKEPEPSKTRSPPQQRSISPRSGSRSRTRSESPSYRQDGRNGYNGRDRSHSRSRSGSREQARRPRERSYTRSPSRSPAPKSSKVKNASNYQQLRALLISPLDRGRKAHAQRQRGTPSRNLWRIR